MLRIILTIALACCAPVHGAPIPPGPVGSFVNNSAAPQTAQFNVSSGTVRGKLTAGEVKVTTLTVSGVIVSSFSGSGVGLTGIPWAGVVKTGSNLNEITTRDHSVLTSTGTNTHAAIDSHILSSAAVHGSTALNLGSRIVQRDASGNFAAGAITGVSFIGPLTGNATTATTATNIAGGSLGTIPYQTSSGTTAMLPVGPFNYVLQGKGALTPTWTSSPTITGQNITAIPLAALSAGTLPASVPASSITVTGVVPGSYGGPVQAAQIVVGSDGRITSAAQYSIPNLDPTVLPHLAALDVATTTLHNSIVALETSTGIIATAISDEVVRATARENSLGVSTGTIKATQDAIILSTGNTYSALQSTGAALTAETLRATARENAIAVSTGVIQADLASEVSRAIARENAIAVSTGSIYSALTSTASALTAETTARIAADLTIGLSTASIYSALQSTAAALTSEISRATVRENALGVSTGTIKATQDAIILSTGALDLAKVPYTGATAALNTSYGVNVSSDVMVTGRVATPRVSFNTPAVAISSTSNSAVGGGIIISTNAYIVGFSSATKYYGDGSSLTGVQTSGGSGSGVSYKYQDFTSNCNGTTSTFTLTNTPLPNSLTVTKNGVSLANSGVDYTLSGVTMTLVSTPAASSILIARYSVADSSFNILGTTNTWTAAQSITGLATISSMTVLGNATFDTETATTSFHGYIDYGSVVVSSITNAGPTNITATCPSGKYVVTGTCYATDGDIRQCGPLSGDAWPWTAWKVQTTGTGYKEASVVCGRIK